ncbi:hypothetical protein D5S18_27175 [Nocardia panacis]|uniref:Uncharacterized protein n=1 Tax=Nocardia panacis TaxID=2340916 RepID=A0A3A4JPC7_9NOCA|nr:hypothetical protein [Nocardia panacis]RJO70868.1 hypothetical protein D5S18_27175 [Nocardia panacis]
MSGTRHGAQAELLALWESAVTRPPIGRALVLAVAGGADPRTVADLPVGRRDEFVMALRERWFGAGFDCVVDCPECAAELELGLRPEDIRRETPSAVVDSAGYRAITSRDLLAAARAEDPRRELLSRCVPEGGDGVEMLAALDPQADVLVELDCAVCGFAWSAPFDIGGYLWAEMDADARRLLSEVHVLASAYGWSEAEVLAVGPARRRRYLEMVAS